MRTIDTPTKLKYDNEDVQQDCIKDLYEIGEREPELIAGYCKTLAGLLDGRNNRLAWVQ